MRYREKCEEVIDIPELKQIPPQPNPKNRRKGLVNRANGKRFEERIDSSFAYYAHTGYALVDKTPEPMKVLKRMQGGKFIACFSKKAQPDYKGTIKGGRTVMFEAKYTTQSRLHSDVVSADQSEYLTKATELGARCYVLAGFEPGEVYRIPWETWASMKQRFGRMYVTEEDLKPYRLMTSWNGRLLILD